MVEWPYMYIYVLVHLCMLHFDFNIYLIKIKSYKIFILNDVDNFPSKERKIFILNNVDNFLSKERKRRDLFLRI